LSDSDDEYDFENNRFNPISELCDQIQSLLIDYRDTTSQFSEKRSKSQTTKGAKTRQFHDFEGKDFLQSTTSEKKQLKTMGTEDKCKSPGSLNRL
jgi:hypothetical protein